MDMNQFVGPSFSTTEKMVLVMTVIRVSKVYPSLFVWVKAISQAGYFAVSVPYLEKLASPKDQQQQHGCHRMSWNRFQC